MSATSTFPARLTSQPEGLRRCGWEGGAFTTAYRPPTRLVEGEIRSPSHLVMATLRGGADRHEIRTDEGHRYDGPDRPGTISFLPAGCARSLRLHGVEWRWATISLGADWDGAAVLRGLRPFSGVEDGFVQGLLAEFERLDALDGGLDSVWRDSMLAALMAYIGRRYGGASAPAPGRAALAPWQVRRVDEMIADQMSGELRIADLAAACGLSEGHFHRAFRAATGSTPLQHVNARRVDAARQWLVRTDLSVGTIAFKVGFVSASHFARIFRQATGRAPLAFRRAYKVR